MSFLIKHPRLRKVVGGTIAILLVGLSLFMTGALLLTFFYDQSREGVFARGIVLLTLAWLWEHSLSLVILVAIWILSNQIGSLYEARERLAQERHKEILNALRQIGDDQRNITRDEAGRI